MAIADILTRLANKIPRVFDSGKEAENKRYWQKFWDGLRFTSDANSYYTRYAFAGGGWNKETFSKIIYPAEKFFVKTTSGTYTFENFNRNSSYNTELIDLSEFCEHMDTSEITSLQYMFHNARAKNITIDAPLATNISYAFNCDNGGQVDNITLRITNKCTNFSNAFTYMAYLTTIRFMEGSEIANSVSFAQSPNLTNESRQSIIDALGTVATTKTLTVHSSVYNRMVESGQDALVTAKNWTLVSA